MIWFGYTEWVLIKKRRIATCQCLYKIIYVRKMAERGRGPGWC